MGKKNWRVCSWNGCAELTLDRYCDVHAPIIAKRYHSDFRRLYSGRRWKLVKQRVLKRDKYICRVGGTVCGPATEVDHITRAVEYDGDFYDTSNLQSLCKSHHSQKTRRETWG